MQHVIALLILAILAEGAYLVDLKRRTKKALMRIETILKKEKAARDGNHGAAQ